MKLKIISVFIAVMMIVSVVPSISFAAVNVSEIPQVSWTQMEIGKGVYALMGYVSSENGVKEIKTALNFDTEVIQPVNRVSFTPVSLVNNSSTVPECMDQNTIGYESEITYDWVEYSRSYKTRVDSENSRASVEISAKINRSYNEPAQFYYSVFHFKLAEGKSWSDVNSETFKLESLEPNNPWGVYVLNGISEAWHHYNDPSKAPYEDYVAFESGKVSIGYINSNVTVSKVAQYGGNTYSTLQEAINSANEVTGSPQNIELIANTTESVIIPAGADIVLDLGVYTLKGAGDYPAVRIISDETNPPCFAVKGSTGGIDGNTKEAIYSVGEGGGVSRIVINSGTFLGSKALHYSMESEADSAGLLIRGGTFKDDIYIGLNENDRVSRITNGIFEATLSTEEYKHLDIIEGGLFKFIPAYDSDREENGWHGTGGITVALGYDFSREVDEKGYYTVNREMVNVTVNPANGSPSYTLSILKGGEINLPEEPVKAATPNYTYTFEGWYNGNLRISEDTLVYEPITITAKYRAICKEASEGDKIISVAEINDNSIENLTVNTRVGANIVGLVFSGEARESMKAQGELVLKITESTGIVSEDALRAFDIALKDGSGNAVELNGDTRISISFELPMGKAYGDYGVFSVNGSGEKTDCLARYENGSYVFNTSDFSSYIIMQREPHYTFKAVADKKDYNVGDNIKVKIIASTDQTDNKFSAFHFTLSDAPQGLTLTELRAGEGLAEGNVAQSSAKTAMAYVIESEVPISVDLEGVVIAEAIYTVNSSADDGNEVEIGFKKGTEGIQEMNVYGNNVSAEVLTEDTAVTLHNIKLILNVDSAYGTIDGANSVTYYARYKEAGLFTDEERSQEAMPVLAIRDGYILAQPNWRSVESTNMAYNTLGDILAERNPLSGTYILQAVCGSFNIGQDSTNGDEADISFTKGLTQDKKATHLTDVEFTVTPKNGKLISQVGYRVNTSPSMRSAEVVDASCGKYKIKGVDITGDIVISAETISYVTIGFSVCDGGELSGITTAYAYGNGSALYSGKTSSALVGHDTFTLPAVSALPGYRVKDEPCWMDEAGRVYSTMGLNNSHIFTEDTVLRAQMVKTYTVTFAEGDNGSLNGTTVITRDKDYVLTSGDIPTPQADSGYRFVGWQRVGDSELKESLAGEEVVSDISYRAVFEYGVYNVVFAENDRISYRDAENTATYGRDYTFKMSLGEGIRVTRVSYTVGGREEILSEAVLTSASGEQTYTIPGNKITGEVSVNVISNNTYIVSINVINGDGGSVSPTSRTYNAGEVICADDFEVSPEAGYTYSWDTEPAGKSVTENKTYTLTFADGAYKVSFPNGAGSLEEEDVLHGTDYTFTPHGGENVVVVAVSADIGGRSIGVRNNGDGTYTVAGDKIIGDITLRYTTIGGVWTFISHEDYKALEYGKNTKVVIFETDKLSLGTYALSGTDMLYSSKYNGYVYITSASETESSLSSKLTVSANPITEVNYSGDTNKSGKLTGMDTIAVNDALKGVTPSGYVMDIPMRLSLDVDGSKSVTVTDITWILEKAVGNHS